MKATPFLLLPLLACGRPEPIVVGPQTTQPEVRIALAVGVSTVSIGGGAALVVTTADSQPAGEIAASNTGRATFAGGQVQLEGAGAPVARESLTIAAPDPDGFVRVNGRDYRGRVVVLAGRAGLTVVNRVVLESYLAGVVSAEMGRRDTTEQAALEAQAVVSRTYAVRNLGRWAAQGFDLQGSVGDQVYGGVASETAMGWQAVTGTAGLILTWNGAPIDAFFHSTCGGRTSNGTEVFAAADRPYLRSIEDLDPVGAAYCRISPRYQWRVEWSAEALRDILRGTLPQVTGSSIRPDAVVQSVRVAERSPSGRVARLAFEIDGRQLPVSGPAVRQVLRPRADEILRSAEFTLTESRSGGRLVRLVADGHGAGHGVGFCQWGAVGRARAGKSFREILAAYFPGTDLERYY